MSLEWLHFENDEPLLVKRIRKDRFIPPSLVQDSVEGMVNFSLRPDDVLLCSYQKSGCHWLWENLRMLLTGDVIQDDIEKEQLMMEFNDLELLRKFPSPRILNNHAQFDEQPSDLLQGKNKVILIYRNPKDICLSYYYHHVKVPKYEYNGKLCNFMRRFTHGKVGGGSIFDYWKGWEEGLKKHPNIPYLLVRYEDLHVNPISERRRLASFLGREYDDAFLQEVTEASSIDSMRQQKEKTSWKDSEGQSIMYRKGKVGDWKDNFTVSQSEWFDKAVEKEMAGSELFHFVYSIG